MEELGVPLIAGSASYINHNNKNDLGTIMGVYIPCICSIFGVVLFERLGWLVGEAGVIATCGMFVIAFTVVFTTALSISAISTNGQMKGGGVYYMISRSLGPEFGGSIGIIFFLANITNGSTFLLGFVEGLMSIIDVLPGGRWWTVLYVGASLVVLTTIGLLGASVFSKINTIIFVQQWLAVITAIASLVVLTAKHDIKVSDSLFASNTWPSYSAKYGTLSVFAIAFPSVTGIMAGANMSGDLRAPHKSIPKGTLFAILTTLITYLTFVFLYAAAIDRVTLQQDYFVMQDIAFNPWLISQGLMAATLSSALACILGGARILQAIARDDLLPFLSFFAAGSKRGDEPRRAVIFAALAMFACVLVGSLNDVLPLVTMFYFTTYGITNFACFLLSISGAPNFRPLFKYYSWWSSLLGAVLCVAGMFVVNPLYAALSMVLFAILWGLIYYRAPPHDWGDLSQAIIYHQVRKYLLRLDSRKTHIKFWRPAVLLFVENLEANHNLIDFTNQLKKGGLYVMASVVIGTVESRGADISELTHRGWDFIKRGKIKCFYELAIASSVRAGVANLTLIAGVGGMRPNAVILGFWQSHSGQAHNHDPINQNYTLSVEEYVSMINDSLLFGKSVLLARNFDIMDKIEIMVQAKFSTRMTIDVWNIAQCAVGSIDASYQLSLQLGYVLNHSDFFKKWCKLRVISLVLTHEEVARTQNYVSSVLHDARIPAEALVVSLNYAGDFSALHAEARYAIINEAIKANSARTAVLFMPIPRPPDTPAYYAKYMDDLAVLSQNLPPSLLVYGLTSVITNEL